VAHTPCSPRLFGPTGPSPARASPPPLSVLVGPPVSAAAFPARAPAPSLSLLAGPLCQLPRPRVTAARAARTEVSRASLTLFPPHLRTCRTPFQPPPRCAHARAPPPLPAAVPSPFLRRRRSPAVPSATVSFASTSATRDTPQFLLSLPDFLCPHSRAVLRAAAVVRHRRHEPSPRLRRHREAPRVRLEVRNLPCPLPSPPLLPAALNSSPESVGAAAEPFRRGPPPPVPLSRPSPRQ
jgi:hypothetical protein